MPIPRSALQHSYEIGYKDSTMNKGEFSRIRSFLGKTQAQMAQLLGVSLKAIQSFEQGWRKIPIHIERQSILLLTLKGACTTKNTPCWTIKECPMETRRNCPAWEFGGGQMCWLINGTVCQGKVQKSWSQKMRICRKCKVFQSKLSWDGKKKS